MVAYLTEASVFMFRAYAQLKPLLESERNAVIAKITMPTRVIRASVAGRAKKSKAEVKQKLDSTARAVLGPRKSRWR